MTQTQRDDLVAQYAHLTRTTASRVRLPAGSALEVEDLVSEGLVALVHAAEAFDASRGVQFQTYAIGLIRGAIVETMRKWHPRWRKGDPQKHGARRDCRKPLSLDRTPAGDCGSMLIDALRDDAPGPEDAAARSEQMEALARAFRRLPEREQICLVLHYQKGWTFRRISELWRVSETRANQLHRRAVKRLRADAELARSVVGG